MSADLKRECQRLEARARSLRIEGFRYAIAGDTITLEGRALRPEAIDSMAKLFATTSARRIDNRIAHHPPEPTRPEELSSGAGYVQIQDLGPDAARLAEGQVWVVRPGDTLEGIALAVYGDAAGAARIRRANRELLPRPDSLLSAGLKLRVPPA